ncbi:SdpI family protein [Thermobifida halotolerans]|uniref:SdpI family protein n=1 Tax=Thermobifida halotolerans TaxID=483545 RepID=A0AA97LY48_9ACTN|nr:SdpI family protein [Thermobifida halotolerans]UOE20116.1 SdpI family protein [Thermobifida halotolerans]
MAGSLLDPTVLSTTAWSGEPLPGAARLALFAVLALAGAAVAATGVMGARERLRPNLFVGIRTAYTLRNERAWYTVHRKSSPWVVASGASFLVGGVGLLLAENPAVQLSSVLAACALTLLLLVTGTVLAHRAARREEDGRPPR